MTRKFLSLDNRDVDSVIRRNRGKKRKNRLQRKRKYSKGEVNFSEKFNLGDRKMAQAIGSKIRDGIKYYR